MYEKYTISGTNFHINFLTKIFTPVLALILTPIWTPILSQGLALIFTQILTPILT